MTLCIFLQKMNYAAGVLRGIVPNLKTSEMFEELRGAAVSCSKLTLKIQREMSFDIVLVPLLSTLNLLFILFLDHLHWKVLSQSSAECTILVWIMTGFASLFTSSQVNIANIVNTVDKTVLLWVFSCKFREYRDFGISLLQNNLHTGEGIQEWTK